MRGMRMVKFVIGLLAAAVVAGVFVYPSLSAAPEVAVRAPASGSAPAAPSAPASPSAPVGTASPEVYGEAARSAAGLPLITAVPPVAYRRDAFGPAWADVDGNGCRQRDDLLARDLVDVEKAANGCTVLRGILAHDPYTGKRIVFQHDRVAEPGNPGSQGVQGEHIVSLKAAWDGGAWGWTDQRRLEFANSLEDVIAVDGFANQSKQDAGPARWMPDTDYRCTYAVKYTQIIITWSLSITTEDRAALVDELQRCETAAK